MGPSASRWSDATRLNYQFTTLQLPKLAVGRGAARGCSAGSGTNAGKRGRLRLYMLPAALARWFRAVDEGVERVAARRRSPPTGSDADDLSCRSATWGAHPSALSLATLVCQREITARVHGSDFACAPHAACLLLHITRCRGNGTSSNGWVYRVLLHVACPGRGPRHPPPPAPVPTELCSGARDREEAAAVLEAPAKSPQDLHCLRVVKRGGGALRD